MKKLFYLVSALLLSTSLFFTGCKKEKQNIPSPIISTQAISEGIVIEDGRYKFESEDVFDSFLGDTTEVTSAKLAAKTASSDTLIDDEFLASILDEHNVIEIGTKAYKLDFKEEKVYVLNNPNKGNILFLQNKEVLEGGLRVYNFEDDVFEKEGELDEYLNSNPNAFKKSKCKTNGPGAPSSTNSFNVLQFDPSPFVEPGVYKVKGVNDYKSYGIYFRLFTRLEEGKEDSSFISWVKIRTDYTCLVKYEYQPRCKNVVADTKYAIEGYQKFFNTPVSQCVKTFNATIYKGSRRLMYYYLETKYSFPVAGCSEYYSGIATVDKSVLPVALYY